MRFGKSCLFGVETHAMCFPPTNDIGELCPDCDEIYGIRVSFHVIQARLLLHGESELVCTAACLRPSHFCPCQWKVKGLNLKFSHSIPCIMFSPILIFSHKCTYYMYGYTVEPLPIKNT